MLINASQTEGMVSSSEGYTQYII